MRWRAGWDVIRQTGTEFIADRAPRLGAALAFYTALSLAPLLLVVIGIAGLAFGPEAARGEIAHQLRDLIGDEGAEPVQTMLAKSSSQRHGIVATVVGLVTLIVGATGVFSQLQDALNTVWNVQAPPGKGGGIWATVKDQLVSFSMVCGLAFLLLVSLVFSALLSAVGHAFNAWLPDAALWLRLGNCALSFLLTTLLFAMIYKVLPHARPAWSDVWVGAAITAVLFNIGKYLIGLYLGQASVGSTFGAAGSFVVLLMWIYYSTQILLLGAEFTQVYSMRFGSGLQAVSGLPKADAPPDAPLPPDRQPMAPAPA